jgi:hypothetical protein
VTKHWPPPVDPAVRWRVHRTIDEMCRESVRETCPGSDIVDVDWELAYWEARWGIGPPKPLTGLMSFLGNETRQETS